MKKISQEEQAIADSFEKGEWVPVKNFSKRKAELIKYARNTLKKDKRLNILISERDLTELQKRAVTEGLPYQTYVAGIIHKFLSGTLVDVRHFSPAMKSTRLCVDARMASGKK